MFQASQREAAQRALAEDQAQSEANARQTAESIMTTAEAEADVAATRAGEAQAAAYVAETAEAEALGAEATAVAARQTADAGREAAVVAEQTAQAARAVALTQQAQAEQNEAAAVAAQQTAQVAEQAAIEAQQTAQAGQATAEASQATAQAQQAQAEAAAQQARQAQAEAEAAAREAEQAQREAEAAAQQAQQAQAAAEETLVAVEALREEAERGLRETQRAQFSLKYSQECMETWCWDVPASLHPPTHPPVYDGENVWIVDLSKMDYVKRVSVSECELESLGLPSEMRVMDPGDGGGGIVFGDGHIWVASYDQVVALTPSGVVAYTYEVTGQVRNLLYDAQEALWFALSSGQVLRLDPSTDNLLDPLPIGGDVTGWAYDGKRYIWIASQDNLIGIDALNSRDSIIKLPSTQLYGTAVPNSITCGGDSIWVLSGDSTISKFQPSDAGATLVYTFTIGGNLSGLAFDGVNVWSLDEDKKLVKIDASDGTKLSEMSVSDKLASFGPRALTFDGANLWVYAFEPIAAGLPWGGGSTTPGILTKIPIHVHPIGESPTAMAEDGRYIWVANSEGNTVSKVVAATGEITGTFGVGPSPSELIVGDENIWVLNAGDNTVSKLRRADGQELGTFSLGNWTSYDLAYDDDAYIWVAQDRGVTRLREQDGESIGSRELACGDSDTRCPKRIVYGGGSIWVSTGYLLLKLNADGTPGETYQICNDGSQFYNIEYCQSDILLHDGSHLWANSNFLCYGSCLPGSSIEVMGLVRVDPTISSSGPFRSTISSPYYPQDSSGIAAYRDKYIWFDHIIRLETSELRTTRFSASICEESGDNRLLYHNDSQSIWVSCPKDDAIQKIYSYEGLPESSALGPASLPPVTLGDGARRVYLPVMMKEAAPAPAGAEPRQTPGVTGPPPSVTPTATATMTPIPIPIPTPTAAGP
jgi:DNA-binding beta-propeller fold protein YncE